MMMMMIMMIGDLNNVRTESSMHHCWTGPLRRILNKNWRREEEFREGKASHTEGECHRKSAPAKKSDRERKSEHTEG